MVKVLSYLRWLSRAVPRRRPATVFMFHSIGHQPTGCDVHSPEVFEAFLGWLTRRTRVVSIADYCAALPQSAEALSVLSFDDGYLDNYTVAYPLLKKYGCPAAFYFVTDWLGRPNMMTAEMVRELARDPAMTVGSHTVSHPRLSSLAPADARRELRDSGDRLRQLAGVECRDFCYPYGDFNDAVKEQVRAAGYRSALAVSYRARLGDPYEVPRSVVPSRPTAWQFAVAWRAPACWSLARRFLDHTDGAGASVTASAESAGA